MVTPSKPLTSPPTAMPNSMEMDGLHGRGQADRLSPAGGVFAGSASSRASSIDAEKDNCSGKKRLRSSNHDDHHSLSRPHPPSTPTNTNNRDNHNVNHSPVIDVGATDVCMQQQKPVQKSSPSAAQSTSSITTFTFPTEERIISTLEKPETSQESQDYEAERRRILFGARTEPTDSTLFDVEALLEATKPYSITYNEDIRSNNDRKRPFTTTLLLKSVDGTVLARLPPMSTETAKFMRKHFPHLYGNKSVGSIFHDLSRFYEESGRHHGCTFDGGFEWERTDDFLWFSDIGTVSDDAEAHFHSILEKVHQRFESPHWSGLPSSLDLDCRRTISMIATRKAQRKLREYSDEKVMIMNALLSKIRSLSEERVGGKASREAIVGLLANVFADMREDANVPVFVSVSPFTMYIAAKLDIHRIVKSEISKTITVASGGATVHIYVYPNSQVPWVASAIDVALLLLPKMYNLPETEKNIAVCNIMMEAVNQATALWQEMQVAKEVAKQEVHIPNEIVNANILPFLATEYQLPECYRFGCTNRACGKVKSGDSTGLSHLRCGESGCEDICAWNNGNERCTASREANKRLFCARQQCNALWTSTRAAFIAEMEDREAAGEKF